ncbi:hypothetical protein ACI5KX_13585 [Erythrobacter sp. GH1-10]|uniref:hypothetical protein n=1 Tax=Erythrobacter sp. GH1-10 TaxID=3349334 RepID=UPI00387814F8
MSIFRAGARAILTTVFAAGTLATPAFAQEDSEPEIADFSGMRPQDVFSMYQETGNRWIREPCTFGVPITQYMSRAAPEDVAVKRAEFFASALCAEQQERFGDAITALDKLDALGIEYLGLRLYVLRRAGDIDALRDLFAGFDGEDFGEIDNQGFWGIYRAFDEADRVEEIEDIALRWWSEGKFESIPLEYRESVATTAFEAAVRRGDEALARDLLSELASPQTYIELLIDRDYEALWPVIAERAGPNLVRVGEEAVAKAKAEFEADPANRDSFSNYAYMLHFNGQFEAAIELAQQWRERESDGEGIEEGDAWALNIEAYAYDSLGQPEKADAVFDQLASYAPEQHDWVVNFVINRGSRLVGQGRWDEGLEAAALARKVAEDYGTTYARMIIARDHACGLMALGRENEVAPELEFLRENASEALGMAIVGLICAGEEDEAAAMLLKGLKSEDDREAAIGALASSDLDLFYTASPATPDPSDLLSDRPELAAELGKHYRDLPTELVPRATLRRKELAAD